MGLQSCTRCSACPWYFVIKDKHIQRQAYIKGKHTQYFWSGSTMYVCISLIQYIDCHSASFHPMLHSLFSIHAPSHTPHAGTILHRVAPVVSYPLQTLYHVTIAAFSSVFNKLHGYYKIKFRSPQKCIAGIRTNWAKKLKIYQSLSVIQIHGNLTGQDICKFIAK